MYKNFIKRILDLLISFTSILILSPVIMIVAILIKLDSKGPIFFKQERLGLNGRKFSIFKFRTMVVNAEKIGDGLSIKNENDNRITKLGKILRNTSLDEIPQLFNIFLGDMSLIGPRPPVVYHPYNGYESYPQEIKQRFKVRPGITGLAQVVYRNSATWDKRFELDIEYVNNLTFINDVKIFFKTFKRIFKSSNIYK